MAARVLTDTDEPGVDKWDSNGSADSPETSPSSARSVPNVCRDSSHHVRYGFIVWLGRIEAGVGQDVVVT